MTYPGNPSLSAEVQQRILTTYRQSLTSAESGNRDEALLGCDFVLRLDPEFTAARTLQQMLSTERPPEVYHELIQALDAGRIEVGSENLHESFQEMLQHRRFAEILNAAERDKRLVEADPELRTIVEQAQARYEADPYVAKFAEAADVARRNGDPVEARRLLEKARSLDPTHPKLAEVAGEFVEPSPAAPAHEGAEGADSSLDLPELDFSFDDLPDAAEAGLEEAPEVTAAPPASDRPPEETSGRILELLDEGQASFDRGEYQGAIDAWSRIFLIDIDHEEAARKIERARQLKSEREREVEEIFHAGIAQFDGGDFAAARETFKKVLELNPAYALAREYLDKIDERESGTTTSGSLSIPDLAPPPEEAPATAVVGAKEPAPRRAPLEIPISVDDVDVPEPRRAVGSGFAATARRSGGAGPSPRFLIIGGAVLVLLGAGGWFLFSQRDQLFPNAEPTVAPATAGTTADPIARAKELHEKGQTAMAVALLRRLPPQDPNSDEAQSLISQWEKISTPAVQEAAHPELASRRRALLEEAQKAESSGENFRARRLFAKAAELAPLDGDWVAMSAAAEQNLQPLAQELQLYKDGDYEYLVNQLWRRREAEPSNRDIARMLVDAYYNLGVLDLQRGDPGSARQKFREARGIDSTDAQVQRLEQFSAAYENRGQDLLYRIFIKYVQMR
jgi:tetratricopeptide (TPR) repeat protein